MQGRNRLHLSALDKDHYCVLVHLAQQRTDSEVKEMMHSPETMEEALLRVQVLSPPISHACGRTVCHAPHASQRPPSSWRCHCQQSSRHVLVKCCGC